MDTGAGGNMVAADAVVFFQRWRGPGVIPAAVYSDWELEVIADATGMQVKVKPGAVDLKGYFFKMSGLEADRDVITIDAADPTNPRIDRIVAYVDAVAEVADIKVVTGTPAGSPTAPALVQDIAVEWQESLALVAVAASETSIESGHVTDDRTFSYPDFDPGATVLPGQISPQGSGSTLDADSVDGWEPGSLLSDSGGLETLASGVITINPFVSSESHYKVDTEAAAASDDLDTISFSAGTKNVIIIIRPQHFARTIIVTNAGNIVTPNGRSIYLTNLEDFVILRYDLISTDWEVIGGVYPTSWNISIPIGDGGNDIPLGVVDYWELPFDGTITYHRLVSEDAGVTIQLDVWIDSYANWPPVVADTIYGTKPALSAAQKVELTSLDVAVAKGDWLGINVDSNTDAQRVTLVLGGYRRKG